MFIAKEKFLDRVEQSFKIYKDNIIGLTLPFIIFNIVTLVVIPTFLFVYSINFIDFNTIFSGQNQNLSIIISLLISAFLFGIVVYLLALIPIQIGVLKSIKQAISEERVTPKENIIYGIKKIFDVFRTYWYIFAYVFLIPALLFITGGLIMLFGMASGAGLDDGIMIISYIIIGISVILGMFFAIYRGIRSTFALVSAVHGEGFTKSNFFSALEITKGKFWRIFWNFLGIGFFGGLLIGLIGGLGESIAFFGTDVGDLSRLEEEGNISAAIPELFSFNIFVFINNIFQNVLGTLLGVFISVFSYVFFLRLSDESKNNVVKNGNMKEMDLVEEL